MLYAGEAQVIRSLLLSYCLDSLSVSHTPVRVSVDTQPNMGLPCFTPTRRRCLLILTLTWGCHASRRRGAGVSQLIITSLSWFAAIYYLTVLVRFLVLVIFRGVEADLVIKQNRVILVDLPPLTQEGLGRVLYYEVNQ
jgi:hypothetical protein